MSYEKGKSVEIVLPKGFEEYDDIADFIQDAKVFVDIHAAISYFNSLDKPKAIFSLDIFEPTSPLNGEKE